jgi:hypothetical protein
MALEGRRIVAAARERGLTLRLLGGLAVRDHCEVLSFCARDHSDLDLVGLRAESRDVAELFAALGYVERREVREATIMGQAQFVRRCVHTLADGTGTVHTDDHADVFYDVFRMDHEVDLRDRLDLEPYTVSSADLLLTKLQVARLESRDVRDVVTLLKDVPLTDGHVAGAIDLHYAAALCARDWGLWYDVTVNLRRCRDELDGFGLAATDRDRVEEAMTRLEVALEAAPKTLAWRLRARLGTRVSWHAEVEEQDGVAQNQ